MKRFLLLALIAVSFVASAFADRTGTMKIRGVNCEYDTLIHRHVGPGVTFTQFQFNEMNIGGFIPYKMRIHLLTIDMTNPYNRLSPYMAEDKYYECATQEQEVRRQVRQGLKPFASVNGFDFLQSPPSSQEPYKYMESRYHLVNEGLIRYENNSTSIRYYTDASKKGHLDYLTMKAKVTSSKGASVEIGQINHFRDHARKNNKLALFCNGMDKAKDTNPADGMEVFLKGNDILVGANQLQVVKKKTGCGSPIDKGQHVITGVGTEIESFLNSLEEGETVSIEIGYIDAAGNSVVPSNTYTSFNPNCVRNGVAHGDPRSNVAYSATGVSKDGNTVFLADLEVSLNSEAPLRCLEDFLIEVGAWNACYNDGGPSAEMTVDGQFVTNNSIGGGFNGRYTPNGIMLYSTAPNDNDLVSIECENLSKKELTVGDSFKLKLFGYNQYGEMINDQVVQHNWVDIKCPQGLGEINSDGKFTATKAGKGEIIVSLRGHGTQVTIPLVVDEQKSLIISPSKVFTGEGRTVQLSVKYVYGSVVTDVDPSQVRWWIDGKYVVSSCNNGLVVPYMDGHATLTAYYNDLSATATVEVENLESEDISYIELTDKVTSAENINLQLASVPHSIYIETLSSGSQIVSLKYRTGENDIESILDNNGDGTINHTTIALDYDNPETYPVTVKSVSPSNTEIKRLIAVYTGLPSGINDLYEDLGSHFEFSRSGDNLTLINCSIATDISATVYSFDGTKLAAVQTYLPEAGSCTVDVKKSEPIIVRVQTKNGVSVFKLTSEQ